MQRDVMSAEIERHADGTVGELLRRINRRIGPHHDGGISDDGAAAELSAALAGVLDAAVIAPFAGVIHVGLALFEKLAVTGERIDALRRRHAGLDLLLDAGLAVGPLDFKALLREQAVVVSDQFRQALERRCGFEDKLFHFNLHEAVLHVSNEPHARSAFSTTCARQS
jgi:hypothetical protein